MALGKNYSDAGGHAQNGHNNSQNAGQYSGDGRQPLAVVDNNTHHSFNSGNRPSNTTHVVCPPPPPPPYGQHRSHTATGATVNHALLTTDPYIAGTMNAMQRTNTEPLLADEEFSELLRDDSLLNRTGSGIFNQLLNENVQPLHVQMAQQDHQYAQPQQVTYVVIPNQNEIQEQQQQQQQQIQQQQQQIQQQQQLQVHQEQQDPLFTISNLPSVWDNLGDELDDSNMSVSLGPSSDIMITSDRLPMHDNSTNISIMDWPGKYAFQISLPSDNTERNKWCYSSSGAKLYLCPNIAVPVGISVNEWILGGSITITPVYKQSQHRSNPVHRCYQCKNIPMCDSSLIEHVVQVDGDTTHYHTTAERLQVSVPLLPPQMGEFVSTYLVKVMCLQTCVGGPNRRPFVLVFTLKNREDEVVGRQTLDVKCCKCPSRDMTNDEKKSGTRNVHEAPRLDEEKRTKVRKLASEIIVGQQKKRPRIKLEPGTQSQLVNVAVPIEFASKIKKIVNQMILAKHMKQIDPDLMLYPEEEDSS